MIAFISKFGQLQAIRLTKVLGVLALSCLYLASCSGSSPTMDAAPSVSIDLSPSGQIEALLVKARNVPTADSQRYQLQAIDLLMQEGKKNLAKRLLENIDETQLRKEI